MEPPNEGWQECKEVQALVGPWELGLPTILKNFIIFKFLQEGLLVFVENICFPLKMDSYDKL